MEEDFAKELTDLLNKHGVDSDLNIPDNVLSEYLISILEGLNVVKLDLSIIKHPFHPPGTDPDA